MKVSWDYYEQYIGKKKNNMNNKIINGKKKHVPKHHPAYVMIKGFSAMFDGIRHMLNRIIQQVRHFSKYKSQARGLLYHQPWNKNNDPPKKKGGTGWNMRIEAREIGIS